MSVVDVMIVLLVVAPTFPALAVLVMLSQAHAVSSPSLTERLLLAFRDWGVASTAAALALDRLGVDVVPDGWAIPLLAGAMLLVSLPSAYWLYLFYRGRFR